MSSDRELKRFWDGSRDYYELAADTNPEAAPERRRLFAYVRPGERILDIGSGSCENAGWLPPGCRYVGSDVSTVGLAMAREKGRQALAVRSDGECLPFADGSFDAVISTWAIEHFHEPGRTLLEAARVLRRGGLMLFVGSAWDLPYALPPSLDRRRRGRIALRRLARQLRSLLDGRHRFEIVAAPRALVEDFVPDADAVHVTQSVLVRRFLQAAGFVMVEQVSLLHNPDPSPLQRALRGVLGRVPLWRYAWGNTLLVARKERERERPAYELLPL